MKDFIFQKRLMRKIVFESLFQMDIKDSSLEDIFFTFEKITEGLKLDEKNMDEAKTYIRDIYQNKQEYDNIIERYSEGWSLERIGSVEKTVMRIFIYELTNKKEIPTKVILNEATELTKTYSTQKAASFVNGIMDRLARDQFLLI
ncbi:transcription antitermination factor NusB [Petrotoga sp. 9PWA.NaAc.5.4]|uniref:transcription antitermination factor NusB n=1 Tax=Petrotoga sp. 9PWA.NaAc.5.4 TaxID=1434328 RepID=UPI000EFAB5B2|nr:transcription antitermination factor NusB [Petrotoga sp. 9PWA.NaAc.5.4]